MSETELGASDVEKAKREARKKFGTLLNEGGWMRDPDGEDHCARCWEKYTARFDEGLSKQLEKDSERTAQMLTDAPQTLRVREGWYVSCEGPGQANEYEHNKCEDGSTIFVSDDGLTTEINGRDLKNK